MWCGLSLPASQTLSETDCRNTRTAKHQQAAVGQRRQGVILPRRRRCTPRRRRRRRRATVRSRWSRRRRCRLECQPAQAAGGAGGRRRRGDRLQQVHVGVEGVGARAQPADGSGVAAHYHYAAPGRCGARLRPSRPTTQCARCAARSQSPLTWDRKSRRTGRRQLCTVRCVGAAPFVLCALSPAMAWPLRAVGAGPDASRGVHAGCGAFGGPPPAAADAADGGARPRSTNRSLTAPAALSPPNTSARGSAAAEGGEGLPPAAGCDAVGASSARPWP